MIFYAGHESITSKTVSPDIYTFVYMNAKYLIILSVLVSHTFVIFSSGVFFKI